MDHQSSITLYEQEDHKFYLLGWEEQEEEGIVQTNQYVILSGKDVVLLDPGGAHVFPRVLANVAELFELKDIKHIFYSHQDPDVSSGITLWLSMTERSQVYISGLWTRFLPHFGIYDHRRITAIPDKGGVISLSNGCTMKLIPSHFLHSTGAFSLYDPTSRILFTGDIGAAIFPQGGRYPVVENFEKHIQYMEGFHKRYMASNNVCRRWVKQISSLDIAAIAPQHGAVIRGDDVKKFLSWFENLQCGMDLIETIYEA
ncbi:MBL fold metallo-hydrolase [Aminobacterium mobile]|uniref:MBL fold metallo-hydrolase n=1 Tax=Aminobacterium mobile TaxID=81467 RepID=UPI003315E6AB